MQKTILAMIAALALATTIHAQEVTCIDAPTFPNQIYLYGEPKQEDVAAEQWYEIAGRGQFVRNVKVPTLIPYLPAQGKSNGAAVIIAPGGAFLHRRLEALPSVQAC